jgi:hypothetical protein
MRQWWNGLNEGAARLPRGYADPGCGRNQHGKGRKCPPSAGAGATTVTTTAGSDAASTAATPSSPPKPSSSRGPTRSAPATTGCRRRSRRRARLARAGLPPPPSLTRGQPPNSATKPGFERLRSPPVSRPSSQRSSGPRTPTAFSSRRSLPLRVGDLAGEVHRGDQPHAGGRVRGRCGRGLRAHGLRREVVEDQSRRSAYDLGESSIPSQGGPPAAEALADLLLSQVLVPACPIFG